MHRNIKLEYRLTKPNGAAIEHFKAPQTFTYTEGDGRMLPKVENALINAKEGDRVRIAVSPDEGFGQYRPENRRTLLRNQIRIPKQAKVGDALLLPIQGFSRVSKILELDADHVTLDGNHPLAGMPLVFHINICKTETLN